MDRKVLHRMTVPIVAGCFLLADCTSSTTTTPGPTTAFAVTRFTDAGALDTTFAAGRGVAITDINPALFDFAVAIAVQPDNKIIAAGSSGFAGAGIIALVRHNAADGTLDTGFGTGGIVTTPTPTGWTSASATTVAVQPADSKIVVAAVVFNGPSGSTTGSTGIVLLRYNTDGKLDTGFGTGASGLATPLPIGSGFPGDTCGLVLQPDGKPVVVGASSDGKIVLARYTVAGILDTTFGDASSPGITTTNLNTLAGDSDIGLSPSIGLQSGGQIIVASVAGKSFGPPADHVVLRYGTNGALDTTFGAAPGGIVITNVAGGGNVDFPNALAVQ
ncbi:MAG TPA: delta-60 repeat domain-containing protein, partial [Burkholderiales bacterium]|nr:delta-60 repeat domain-containing protein [Burkholderiales bacterium]